METDKDFVEKLGRLVSEYANSPSQELLFDILSSVFSGVADNHAVPCPVHLCEDGKTCEPLFAYTPDGWEGLAILTRPNEADNPPVVNLKLRGLMHALFQSEDCKGIIFNPLSEHKLFIPKMLFVSAFLAAWEMINDDKKASNLPEEV